MRRLVISVLVAFAMLASHATVQPAQAQFFRNMLLAGGGAVAGAAIVLKGLRMGRGRHARAGNIRHVNPDFPKPGHKYNCVNCAIATDSTLAGKPMKAKPSLTGRPISVLEDHFKAKFGPPTTIEAITEQIKKLPKGTRGIIHGMREKITDGHVFNVKKGKGGVVEFFDGQIGKPASLEGYKSFQLLKVPHDHK